MIAIGIDPGLHFTGIAVVDALKIHCVQLVKVPAKTTGVDAVVQMIGKVSQAIGDLATDTTRPPWGVIVVEGQQVYRRRHGQKTGKPEDLLRIAHVAGGALSECIYYGTIHGAVTRVPDPADWKGQVPKHVSGARSLHAYGFTSLESFKKHVKGGDLPDGQLEHVLDAVGLAHWGLTKGLHA